MKHVILQMLNKAKTSQELFNGLDPSWVKKNCSVIEIDKNTDERTFSEEWEELAYIRYEVGPSPDWDNVFGNIRQKFLNPDSNFQLDLITDGAGSGESLQVMQTLQRICLNQGMMVTVKLLFLANIRSPYYADEQNLYNEIKQSVIDAENGQPIYRWNCVYLLMTDNEQQLGMQNTLLPYLLQYDCSSDNQTVKAVGGQIRIMDIKAIEQVPRELSIQAACSVLNRTPKVSALSTLLLNKNANGLSAGERLSYFQAELNDLEKINFPQPVDLLVQKQTPLGEASTRELYKKFCLDNPQSDPSHYEEVGVDALIRMPVIVKSVSKWEKRVIKDGCADGDLSSLIDMLGNNSEFDQLLRGYQPPEIMKTEKMLTAEDGYSERAIQKLGPYIDIMNQMLNNAIFAARIKLIRSRLPILRNQLIQIRQKRKKAVDLAMADNHTQPIRELIDSWSRKISNELFNESLQLNLPEPDEDPNTWIQQNAGKMLSRIVPPDLDEGREELNHSGMRIIDTMRTQMGEVLLPYVLRNGRTLADKWIVYNQFKLQGECIASTEPIVVKLVEMELDLRDPMLLDQQLFTVPLTPPKTPKACFSDNETSEEVEEEIEDLSDFQEEELEEFMGTLIWIWDDTQYQNARVEAYADTGTLKCSKKLKFTKMVRYRSDDRYAIGEIDKLPSGVPIVFRIIYLDQGKEVEGITREIHMKAPRTVLEVNRVEVIADKKLGFFGGKPYARLKITPSGPFDTEDIAIGSSSGHFYSATWENSRGSWISELLPYMEEWRVVDRPGDLIEYQIIQ